MVTGNVMRTLHEIDGLTKAEQVCSLSTGGCGKMERGPCPWPSAAPTSACGIFRCSEEEENMVKELYQTVLRETSLNVTNGEIDSVRKKSITKSGCRVYDGGFLGVAGTLGEPTAESWARRRPIWRARSPAPGGRRPMPRTCRRGAAMDADRFLHLCES